MNEFTGDLFATKGLEYILVIGYLAMLVVCWRFVRPRAAAKERQNNAAFPLPEGYHFHPGHAWARPVADQRMRVGLDAFAAELLDGVEGVELPAVGTTLTAGEPGWKVRVGGRTVEVLAPVDGEVVARNDTLVSAPDTMTRAPYDGGWVVEVQVPDPAVATRNLLSGSIAGAWRNEVIRLREEGPEKEDLARVRAFLRTDTSAGNGAGGAVGIEDRQFQSA